jgi:CO/xanthine dehydrogenase Mo-binding subunit
MTVDELATKLELDTDKIRERVMYLAKFERIHQEEESVYLAE